MVQLYLDEQVDYIYTEDSDLVAHGNCPIVRSLKSDETCSVLNEDIIEEFLLKYKKSS